MKKIILSVLLSTFFFTLAYADWIQDFDNLYNDQGIEPAVVKALEIGSTPEAIVNHAITIEGLNPQNLLKALYCAGVPGDDIKAASDKVGISEIILVASFHKALAECRDSVADTQAYTPVPTGPNFAGVPMSSSSSSSGGDIASPNTF